MQAFWTAFAQLFSTLTTLFSAAEKGAKILDNVAGVGVMKSDTYLKEAEHDQAVAVEEFAFNREQRKATLDAKRKAIGTSAKAAAKATVAP